ncbi:MAG TPA: plastocyanin/azurin family copper-binding protein, partial [Vicinamibacterales bacterium]
MSPRPHVLLLSLALALSAATIVQGQKGRVIEITGNDQMKFSVTRITAKPGETLTVRLKTVSALPKIAMAHNFVLLAAGTDAAAFANAAATASSTAYIPPAMKSSVLASTGLAGAGETVEVTFKAPTKPGQYDYICSFPGHFVAGMKGVLVVQ